MKKDERRIVIETREWIARRNRPTKRFADSGASAFGKLKITVNGMPAAIDFSDAIIKQARTFARIAHSVDFFGAADFCDQRAAEQPLKIERQIGPDRAGFLQPRQQTPWHAQAAKFAARKKVDMIHIGISAEQRRKLGINHPRNLGVRVRIAKQGHRRKGVDDISERTRLND